ncbi:L-rhamnose/proton symporter RhaT [Parapedobacter sp. 2B3]|uniref:L-rhamnose/proton symporter RhaT n=1 Tax=Parapedobacter sp. 2B3 TaxID=3342381 RepID=UPI0035B64BEF
MSELSLGLLLVVGAGLGTGTIAWPLAKIKTLRFEYFLFTYMLVGIVLIPWVIMLCGVRSVSELINVVGVRTLLIANLLSVSWGVANVIYLVCVIRIGAAITGAVLTSLGMSVGVIMPLLVRGDGRFADAPTLFSNQGVVILIGLLVLLVGVVLTSRAGLYREKLLHRKTNYSRSHQIVSAFRKNILLVVLAGVLSAGISLTFVYSQDAILGAVLQQGASETVGNFSVWALAMLGGAVVNVGYGVYLMVKRKSLKSFSLSGIEVLVGYVAGAQFILSIVLMGKGMVLLGALGASVGFAIQQSTQILGNQIVGFVNGEWKEVRGSPRKTMYWSIAVIILGVILLAGSNSMY